MEKKEKQAIYYFLGWIITGILICFIGISNVFALNTDSPYVKIFDNYGTSLTEVATNKVTSPKTHWTATIPTIVSNSYGGAIIIQTETPLAKNVNYSISIFLNICKSDGSNCYNPAISSKSNLGIGTGVQLTKDSYFDNTAAEVITKEVTGNYIYYNFTTKTNGSYILIPFTSITSCSGGCIIDYYGYDLVSNGLASDLTQQEITNITTNQTNELNQSIQNSTDTITGEIDDMEQSIIDSNKETQDVIKDQFNTCRDSNNLLSIPLQQENNTILRTIIPNFKKGTYTFSFKYSKLASQLTIRIETEEGSSVIALNYNSNKITFNLENDTDLNISIYKDTGILLSEVSEVMLNEGNVIKDYEPYGEICSNKIDETNDQLGNLNDSLNDSNVDGSLNGAGSFFDSFQSSDHGGLSGIITAPLVAINEMLNTTCNPMTATFKGKELSLPCGYDFWNKMGAIQDFLNVVLGGMLCYNIVKKLFKLIERIKNPEDDRIEVMDL